MLKKFLCIFVFLLILLNVFSRVCFALSPSSNQIYEGIDVSNWQGYIDYTRVKDFGIEIVYIKASQGSNIVDPYFKTNYNNAKANDLNIGFYHFLTAKTKEEAINEAIFFSSVISATTPDCRLAMDFENFDGLAKDEINNIARAFLEKVQELTGKEVIIYSDAFNARNTFDSTLARDYPLWIAEYDVSLPTDDVNWNNWVGFQFTNLAIIPGIGVRTDRDKFSQDIFLSSKDVISTPPNNVNKIEEYIVKRGNTLSQIALEFGTTVDQIAGLNGIRNPNLIFPGEVLDIDVTRNLSQIQSNEYEMSHIIYTVKRGNTLTYIADMFNVTIDSIVRLNNISNPNLIFTGERLRINVTE